MMNNEKAIEKLMKHKGEVCRGCIHPQMMGWCEEHCMLPKALDMAIEALKDVQNCVHCEHYTERETDTGIQGECKMDTAHRVSEIQTGSDLISREEVLRMIIVAGECEPDLGYTHLHTVIESLPSAEPKTGEWVRLEREENVYDLHGVPTWGVNYMCDKCGFITTAIQDHFGQYKWCPSCGADMRGEEE